MRYPFVWRKTAEDEVQTWKSRAEDQRRRAERAEKSLKAEVAARRRATELYSDLFDEHERVTGQNAVLCAQVEDAKAAGFDPARAKQTADRIARLAKAVARARAEAAKESRRANQLQSRLDDAVGLKRDRITDSACWQPGYKEATA